jgi:hypothetical protein
MMKIAQRGKHTFALAEKGADPTDPDLTVMLHDELTDEKAGPFFWQSLLARGYWKPVAEATNLNT